MWEILYVIKNKNKYEKIEKERRKQELDDLKEDGIFRVALSKDINLLKTILDDSEVSYVEAEVDQKYLINFHKALHYEEMKIFRIAQGNTATKFKFKAFDI